MGLTKQQIEAIYAKQNKKAKPTYQHVQYKSAQKGPLRWYERGMRCVHHAGYRGSGCGSPTHCKVEGEPLCMMHALHRLNELLILEEEHAQKRLFKRVIESKVGDGQAVRP